MNNRDCFWKPFSSERVNESQSSWNLQKNTFIILFHHSDPQWVWKSYFQSDLKFLDCSLTRWLPTTSIFVAIERIDHYKFKANYLKNHQNFGVFFLSFRMYIKLQFFRKKYELHRSNISVVIDYERCAYFNA